MRIRPLLLLCYSLFANVINMNLRDLLNILTPAEKVELAKRAETQHVYLIQCASGFRKPSPALCQRLVAADSRLTLAELRPDVYGAVAIGESPMYDMDRTDSVVPEVVDEKVA